jgi:hypothetical protein
LEFLSFSLASRRRFAHQSVHSCLFDQDAGAKELREALANHDGRCPVTVSWEIDNGNQVVTKTSHFPFTPVDRIADYDLAFRVFNGRLSNPPDIRHNDPTT